MFIVALFRKSPWKSFGFFQGQLPKCTAILCMVILEVTCRSLCVWLYNLMVIVAFFLLFGKTCTFKQNFTRNFSSMPVWYCTYFAQIIWHSGRLDSNQRSPSCELVLLLNYRKVIFYNYNVQL